MIYLNDFIRLIRFFRQDICKVYLNFIFKTILFSKLFQITFKELLFLINIILYYTIGIISCNFFLLGYSIIYFFNLIGNFIYVAYNIEALNLIIDSLIVVFHKALFDLLIPQPFNLSFNLSKLILDFKLIFFRLLRIFHKQFYFFKPSEIQFVFYYFPNMQIFNI